MKTPQRKFVVEFKSGRRQSKSRENSIWGDTDFKALAREVEDKTSHLFNSNEAPGVPDKVEDRRSDSTKSDSVSKGGRDADVARATLPSIAGAEVEEPKQHEADRPAADDVGQVQESRAVSQPRKTSTRTSRKSVNRAPTQVIARVLKGANEEQSAQSGTAGDPISFDELAALDAENKRLTKLLAASLHAQNLQLKKMLERFDVTEV